MSPNSEAPFVAQARESAGRYYKPLNWIYINSDYAAFHIGLRMKLIAFQMSSMMSQRQHARNIHTIQDLLSISILLDRVSTDKGTSSFKFQFWTKD